MFIIDRYSPCFEIYNDCLFPFFNYFLAVSAWNDNGQSKFVSDEKYLYRSDFFPGLGWMMPRCEDYSFNYSLLNEY